jgi:hypothetical protein
MKKNEYTILKRQIPDVNLHSLTGTFWFDTEINDWKSWYSGSVPISGMVPSSNETGSLHLVRDIKWYPDITYTGSVVLFYSGKTYQSLTGSNLNNIPSGSVYWKEVEQVAINNTKGKYYKWDGDNWNLVVGTGTTSEEIIIDFNRQINQNYTIPIALEASADEMGVMVSFDGNMEQVEQLVNFTYKISGSHVTIYSTVNPDKLRKIVDQDFTIDWGVKQNITGSLSITGSLDSNGGVLYSNFPTASFNYTQYTSSYTGSYEETYSGSNISSFDISIFLNSPWSNQKITKNITIFNTGSITDNVNVLGTFSGFTIPYTQITGSLNYLNDYEYSNTGYTATPTKPFKFMAIGISRIGELRKYGESTVSTSSYTTGLFSGSLYSGYTLPNDSGSLYYMDLADGYTMITGSVPNYRFGPTSGYTYEITGNTINTVPYLTTIGNTTQYDTEYVINHMLTRNEHFLGFIDDPTVYSDIFVERGRQGVMEVNLRLGEIDNMSELDVYGNGFFKVKKQ